MADKAKKYALKKGRLKASRILAINGGYKEEPTTELWTVPAGAEPPTASPVLDPSEVIPPKVITKTKSKKPATVKKTKPKKSR